MAYKRQKITSGAVMKMLPGDVISDTEIRGFMVRRQRKETSFSLKYVIHSRQRLASIGILGDGNLTVGGARKKAEIMRGQVGAGVDPQAQRDKAKAATTIARAAEMFALEHVKPKLRETTARRYRDLLERIIVPTLGKRHFDTLTRGEVARWHAKMAATPVQANLALRVLSSLHSFASMRFGLDSANPTKGVRMFAERKIERYLTDDEAARLWDALDHFSAPKSGIAPQYVAGIRLLLLTGARYTEILGAHRAWIDEERAQLRIPTGMAKTADRILRLSPEALEVVRSIPVMAGNPYLIPGAVSGKPYRGRSTPWKRILKHAGIENFRPNDLRHSWASSAVTAGASLYAVGAHLGHASPSTTRRYAHLAPDAIRDIADSTAARIAGLRALRQT